MSPFMTLERSQTSKEEKKEEATKKRERHETRNHHANNASAAVPEDTVVGLEVGGRRVIPQRVAQDTNDAPGRKSRSPKTVVVERLNEQDDSGTQATDDETRLVQG
eukprot:CAMPEP_0194042864 /NCGR_PEP_ID=MMETSP0009_2-20130614/14600_1 /TAXON_ID=210454 /ORGANISM="Grammatophora oceanica, Strain CCMP 410" /LENGTH=105 /DNA_ID=CAMNT_0038686885 /DNA_START=14 /DNA_END=327 /DNA_ORIENTATION=+